MAATGVPSVTSAGAPVRSGDLAGRTAFLSIRRPGRRRGAKIALAAFTYILALLSVPALASPASAAGGSTPPASTRYVAVGGQPPLPPGAHLVGSVPPNQVLHFDVVLQPRDPAGLARLATSVSTPGLPEYRKYLQKGAFARVFGPRASTISSVRDELRSLGLNVGSVSPNDLLVPVSATASHVQAALRIRMALFRLGGSRIAFANESAPSLPSDIAPDVLGIVGLNSLNRLVPLLQQGSMSPPQGIATHSRAQNRQVPSPHSSGPSPCSAAASTAQKNASYTDNEIAAAYGLTSLYAAGDLGAGETIGLPEFGGSVSTSDISTYESCLGVTTQVNQIPVDGGSTGSTNPEAELDIEDVIGLAPDATIDVYEAPNGSSTSSETAAILDDLNQIASDDAAQVVSYSYGYCESGISSSDLQAINTIFEQMASQGQSVFVASGDGGSESENVCNPPVPASISCSSSSSCMVVDTHGNAMAYDGKAWSTPEPFDTAGVPTSLSCPTTSFCVVVDTSGNALSYDGSSWSQPLNIDPSRPLTSVSCATTSFCMAVDVAGNALSYDGSSWSSTPIDPNGALVGVSCPSTGFCVAVDATGYSIFYENGAWGSPNQFAPGDTITSVACASSSVCMAGDKVGDIWTYADGNTQPWPMLSQGYVTSISCPSNDFCIAVDSVGGALKWNGFQ
ncbi:MAG: protease pro-enzyme activation domain-containing protein, partial [Actinobacteria bacterium]|nr:protease pro-enzyme activation domain-containing protein [Actinomycetota bacterium]